MHIDIKGVIENIKSHKPRLVFMAWRNLLARPGRTILTLLGIALGVAAILATSITNRNVANTLDRLFERTLGSSELQIIPLGNKNTISKTAVDLTSHTPGVQLVVPNIQIDTVLPEENEKQSVQDSSGQIAIGGTSIEVIGINPADEPKIRTYSLSEGRLPESGRFEVLVPKILAEDNDLALNGKMKLFGPNGDETLMISGFLNDEGAAMINSGNVIFIPIDIIQDIFSLEDGYTEINIKVEHDIADDPQALSELKGILERRLEHLGRVIYPSGRSDLVPRMSSAYQFSLSFFSIVALFMGAFLIYNTFATTVMERTQEIGMLRAIGMLRKQVIEQVLIEAGILSVLGCVIGFFAGIFLSRGLIILMRGFFQVEGNALAFTFGDLVKSMSVGILGTFIASLLPARQAARTSPVEALAIRGKVNQTVKPRVWTGGFVLLSVSLIFLVFPVGGSAQWQLSVRMSALITFLLGTVLTLPIAVTWLEPFTRQISLRIFGGMGGLGSRNITRSVSRTMVTIASLAISLIMIIEVNSLVYVMKQDISDWLDNAMGADIIVRAPYAMPQSFARKLEIINGVDAVSPSHIFEIQVANVSKDNSKEQNENLYFIEIDPQQFRKVGDKELVSGQRNLDEAWALLDQGNALFVSSVVADEYNLAQDDQLVLQTIHGQEYFTIAALTSEFDQDGLVVTGTYSEGRTFFGEKGADMFSIKTNKEANVEDIAEIIRNRYEKSDGIKVQTTKTFKEGVMVFYDHLTSLFNVLGLIGVIIGTIGLLNTMSMNVMERTREMGMLRALGCQRKQMVNIVLAEALIIGIISAIYGFVFGYILSRVLVTAANLISGYDLQFVFNAQPYLLSLLIALGVSQIATLIPARRAARVNIMVALKHE